MPRFIIQKIPDPNFGKKTQKFKDTHQLLATHIPIPVAEHFGMYCAYMNVSRTEVVRRLVTEYLIEYAPPMEQMIDEISEQYIKEWEEFAIDHRKKYQRRWGRPSQISLRWTEFIRKIKKRLKGRKLKQQFILEIIEKMEDKMTIGIPKKRGMEAVKEKEKEQKEYDQKMKFALKG